MTSKLQHKFQSISNELKNKFFERDRIIDAALTAVLSKHHMLQLGVPGTAKSALTSEVCRRIEGAQYFEKLLTRFSTPEDVFGPPSLKGLENDEYRRVTTGMLPEAHIAFVDEIFKANAAILNSLLTIINERQFDNPTRTNVPLVSVFGASNELPEEQELDALYDRFLLRFDVKYLQDGSNWESLIKSGASTNKTDVVPTVVTLDELERAQLEVTNVDLPDEVVSVMRDIKMMLEKDGIVASDRRWKQTVRVLQAWSWLHGNTVVQDSNLDILCDMLWRTPEERTTLVEKILSVTNPLDLEATKILDQSLDVFSNWDKSSSASTQEIVGKLKTALSKIDSTLKIADSSKTTKMKEVQSTIKDMYRQALEKLEL